MLAIDGDKSASQDNVTRQKIACFPPEIHDPDLLSKIKGIQIMIDNYTGLVAFTW